jgi:hypothetical protein
MRAAEKLGFAPTGVMDRHCGMFAAPRNCYRKRVKPMFKRILCPIDFDGNSLSALRLAGGACPT